MEDLKIFEEVSLECDEKGTMPYRGGHSHGTVGLLDVPAGGVRCLSTTTAVSTAEEARPGDPRREDRRSASAS